MNCQQLRFCGQGPPYCKAQHLASIAWYYQHLIHTLTGGIRGIPLGRTSFPALCRFPQRPRRDGFAISAQLVPTLVPSTHTDEGTSRAGTHCT